MKILYVKNNSERAKEFQLKTIVYEENGQKYVKKEALNQASIPHLKKMKESYYQLAKTIINPKIKLAKVIDETEQSITFEFIDGISLEQKFQDVLKHGKEASLKVLESYLDILKNGFKTTTFNSASMVTEEFQKLFGKRDYTHLNGEVCFKGISNLDLIFSNIIYKDDDIYLIDYEWVYEVNVPVNYILYRPLSMLHTDANDFLEHFSLNTVLYNKMERHFVDAYVMDGGFYFQKENYLKINSLITEQIEQLKSHVQGKEEHIQELASKIHAIGEDLSYARSIVDLRDEQVKFLSQVSDSLRLKSRIKRLIPASLLSLLGKTKQPALDISNFPTEVDKKNRYQYKLPTLSEDVVESMKKFQKHPLISIVMPVYNVDPKWLDLAITSIESQWYENWELCIADDKSPNAETIAYLKGLDNPKIKVVFLEKNINISGATNAALEIATGEYIALMDNDDEITPDALYEMVR